MNAEELCGKVLGTCTLQKVIGRGGMGAVYLAQQSRPRRQVAVKVLLPITTLKPQQHKAFLERFRRETDAAASLEHPNITPVHEYGELDGLAYLVMPYISGGTLRDELDTEGRLPLTRVVSYLEQMAAALDFAHEHKVVHRDIKPANILMTPEKRLLLTDFGLVKIITDGKQRSQNPLSEVGMPMGTPDYMAPEQVVGGVVDARADIYSLGVLLYHMVAGTPPFQGETPMKVALQHLHTPPPLPRMYRPDLPPAAEQVILRALAKSPADRYLRTRDLASAFRLALEAAGVQVDGSAEAGNRRRGLFDPVWQSPIPAAATPQQEQMKAVPGLIQQAPQETVAKAAQSLTARRDIVAQTRMTLPSFSGIFTEADISASAQPAALPGDDSLLQTEGVPETPNRGLTPLPPTIGTETRQGSQRSSPRHTPLPPVAEHIRPALYADRKAENGIGANARKMFMPPRLKLGHKTNLRELHKGASKPGEFENTAPTLPQPLLAVNPDQSQSEAGNKRITRNFGLVTGMQIGTTTTDELARLPEKTHGQARTLLADQQEAAKQKLTEARSLLSQVAKQKLTEARSLLSQQDALATLIKTYKKTALLAIVVILLVLGSIIYTFMQSVFSTPASGNHRSSNNSTFAVTAYVNTWSAATAETTIPLSDPLNVPIHNWMQGVEQDCSSAVDLKSESAYTKTQQWSKQPDYY
ncbi:serine/threonine-protein kinase [Dictyobacter formicarum]|uniref:non-specific serine/threonine protein kinase n=1 Tax=Dictyobacter formicarum TaxID=2778368 RepID=A0ABQ3VLV0_9CHLR|nr:serine/threonine-protein kinase [Dictyobacter formicarum]GHO87192.1 hypothetical protein KSZ_51980 [Dictyobacter formicarum]